MTSSMPSAPAARSRTLDMPDDVDGPFAVTKVVDGDTIWVRVGGDRVKLRLIGIDTPETVDPGKPVGCFGPEASAEAARLLSDSSVYLELDPSQGETDRYDRTLAYVWMADGTMFNLEMIRKGFAREYTYDDPYEYQAPFREAEQLATSDGVGLWAAC